jgi:hypothetical protein
MYRDPPPDAIAAGIQLVGILQRLHLALAAEGDISVIRAGLDELAAVARSMLAESHAGGRHGDPADERAHPWRQLMLLETLQSFRLRLAQGDAMIDHRRLDHFVGEWLALARWTH